MAPRSGASPGRSLRDPTLLWSRSGHLLIAEKLRVNTAKVISCLCREKVLSNVWWTISVRESISELEEEELCKIIAFWLNSSMGWITFVSHSVPEKRAYMQFKKPTIETLPILEPNVLTREQVDAILELYEQVSTMELQPYEMATEDPVRIIIDNELTRILHLPNIEMLRTMLSNEPIITLRNL